MKEKPRILMFAPLCYPPAGSEAIVTSKLILAMVDAGWEIDVISQADFGQYYPVDQGEVWAPVEKVVHNLHGNMKSNFFGNVIKSTGIQSYIHFQSLNWVRKAVCDGWKLLKKRRYDFILSRAAPQYGHLPALILSYFSDIPWIAHWSDPMPPQKAPPPYGKGALSEIPFGLRNYYRTISYRAYWHIFPCDRLQKYICSYLPELVKKSSVIPHITLSQFSNNLENNTKVFSICHIGNLDNRDPRVFVEGLKQFLSSSPTPKEVTVRFVGTELEKMEKMVRDFGLSDIIIIEYPKSYIESQKIMAQSNLLLLIEAPFNEGVFFPSKFVDYIQTGQPILAISPKVGTISDILSSNGGGITVDCRSPEAVSEAIRGLYLAWETGNLKEKYGSSKLFYIFSEKKIINQYLEIFNKIKPTTN